MYRRGAAEGTWPALCQCRVQRRQNLLVMRERESEGTSSGWVSARRQNEKGAGLGFGQVCGTCWVSRAGDGVLSGHVTAEVTWREGLDSEKSGDPSGSPGAPQRLRSGA